MDQFEKNLGQALGGRGQFDKAKSDDVRKEALKMYDDKLKLYRWITWGFLLFETVLIIIIIGAFTATNDTKWLIGLAAAALAAYESTILMKLWYWQMDTKLRVTKEVKELQLQIAELTQKLEAGGKQDIPVP